MSTLSHAVLGFIVAFLSTPARAAISYTDLYTMFTGLNRSSPTAVAAGGQVAGYGYVSSGSTLTHAEVWTKSSYADLNPNGFLASFASGTDGTHQVGAGGINSYHALLWNGSAATYVDLNPSGFTTSYAYGVSGTQQVGRGIVPNGNNYYHALLWAGSAASYMDLNPSGFTESAAFATNGAQEVGDGYGSATGNNEHALLWNGSAASALDLNPSGFTVSYAYGTSGVQQVGYGYISTPTGNFNHALLWGGSANSYVDLQPTAFTESFAYGTSGAQQVGDGYGSITGQKEHALLWNGSSASYVDLGAVLPATFSGSYAYSITGNTVYGYAQDSSGYYHAIAWSIPEPASLWFAPLVILVRRRRGRRCYFVRQVALSHASYTLHPDPSTPHAAASSARDKVGRIC
jgi:hypothetical protein